MEWICWPLLARLSERDAKAARQPVKHIEKERFGAGHPCSFDISYQGNSIELLKALCHGEFLKLLILTNRNPWARQRLAPLAAVVIQESPGMVAANLGEP